MLEVKNVSKFFGGLTAIKNVSLKVQKGEIFGLIGPNGAGKTTLFNMLTGIYSPNNGEIVFEETMIQKLKPFQIARLGVSRTFQNIRLLGNETVAENVKIGMFRKTKSGLISAIMNAKSQRKEEQFVEEKVKQILMEVGLENYMDLNAGNLSYGNQRKVEIARALVSDPKLILLDEPCAGMNDTEVEEINLLVKSIRDKGTTVIIIEHNVPMLVGLCDSMAVLNHGEKIADGSPEQVTSDSAVVNAYIGSEEEEVI
ncbi:ABC transporter ATP-binding protein [Bacillus sp. DTU_2020_1000418_1_SI_GHA_SEK_038]|uniref:ABC transporter ATP-binding protein n=1 Tax=Bacillus sp. DTU_2020_1000418_1_SI_GHA_SEK_038 TaxID=3077585 RepID=UPI0028E232BF|nr:ABC transporter ATP-binding protein [Bacillus sp. DTU_2020_1000418_1_SI_GHA_SEK_038]WNS76361.1 ABC transporter ATP-binding protein [Bacillus sp. DTU_2020_1000418_1_SI_GHA_SEK_038]